jgi:hypothetical protein
VRTYTRCRVSAMKRPDFIVQGVYNETPWLRRLLKIGKLFYSADNCLLFTIGFQIPALIFRLPQRPPMGPNNDAHAEVNYFFN